MLIKVGRYKGISKEQSLCELGIVYSFFLFQCLFYSDFFAHSVKNTERIPICFGFLMLSCLFNEKAFVL